MAHPSYTHTYLTLFSALPRPRRRHKNASMDPARSRHAESSPFHSRPPDRRAPSPDLSPGPDLVRIRGAHLAADPTGVDHAHVIGWSISFATAPGKRHTLSSSA
eukprot:scaffold1960_cov332-Prasinococcus_capsulatus_cf.AAC.7